MLREVRNARQIPGDPPRRWFSDEYFDLIVWYEEDGSFYGFQLCYDLEKKPRALTWTNRHGYHHAGIDTGENTYGGGKESPVLTADGLFDAPSVGALFEKAAAGLPHEVAAFVKRKVKEFRLR